MNHLELIAVPVLMLADYALTILGAKNSAVVYRNHFRMPSYELNPLWRQSVDRIQWFNARHFALVALVTVLLILLDQAETISGLQVAALTLDVFELALGMLFGAFASICGRHLTNLLLFRYLIRHPQEISGQVQLSMTLVLKMSQFSYFGWIPLFIIVVVLVPDSYTVGVLLGLMAVVMAHVVWARKLKSLEVS